MERAAGGSSDAAFPTALSPAQFVPWKGQYAVTGSP
jgi:hypothetical protein